MVIIKSEIISKCEKIRQLQMKEGGSSMPYSYDIINKALDVYANVLKLQIMVMKGEEK